MKDIFKKVAEKIDKDISKIYFLYEGDVINKEDKLSKFSGKEKEIVILICEYNIEEMYYIKKFFFIRNVH